MADQVTCPVIKDILSENECLENFGGLGVNVYVFIKSDLAAPLEPEAGKNTYATLSAAPPRESPSSFVRTNPVKLSCASKFSATFTAS